MSFFVKDPKKRYVGDSRYIYIYFTKASRRPGLSIGISEAKRSEANLGGVGGEALIRARLGR